MTPLSSVRIDKWLWAVRLYKTRTLAANACRHGGVLVNGQPAKPSREVRLGETITAKTGHITRTVRVSGLIEKRVSAPVAAQNAQDHTPPEEYAKPREKDFSSGIVRPRGAGRPTKRDRRKLEELL